MDTLQSLMAGLATALHPDNIIFAFIGCLWGTMVGVLPGIGPVAGTAMLIPLTFHLPATGAIIMLAAIYYGAQYGGTITSVLMNVPGEASSAITCLEGYPMARQGRGGIALTIAAVGSFIGGTVATIGLVVAAPPLARMALRFGPPETFALMFMGLSLIMGLAGKSVVKALTMGVFGLLVALIGMDPTLGIARFTFGREQLVGGLDFIPVVMGLFGVGEILLTLEAETKPISEATSRFIPSRKDLKDSVLPIARGTAIGFILGLIPGMMPAISSFMSYIAERKLSKFPEKFGTGMIEGVAGPETANNAFANAALIPLFTLGIPTSPSIAVLMGAFMMNGLVPGPFLFTEHADFVWAIIASLYVGNLILLVLNLPLIPLWIKLLRIPYSVLCAIILTFTLVGAYSINNRAFDIGVMILFGVIGYLAKKLDYPIAPAVLTFVLGPMMEKALRASLQMSDGNFVIFVTRPIAAALLAIAVLIIIVSALHYLPFGADQVREDSE